MEPLEDRQMMSLTIDLRVAGTEGKTATVTSVGQVIHLEAWATVTGNTSGVNDGLQSVCGSFLSSATAASSVAGNLGNPLVTGDYTGLGAQLGTQQDLNGDGNLDVGSNNNSDIANFFNARGGGVAQDGTVSGNSQSLEFGTLDYTVTNLHFGSATDIQFRLRSGLSSGAFDAVWLQDNAGENDQIASVLIGAPVVINDPNLSPPAGKISGTVDKSVSGSSSAFAGVTVDLDNSSNTAILASTTTAANGSYSFTGLSAGSYALKEIVPTGYSQTSPSSSPTIINLSSNSDSDTENFVNTAASAKTASFAGTVFKDVNGSTSPFGGVEVYLDLNNNGSVDAGEPTITTGTSGNFDFTGLAPRSYQVREVVPSGYTLTNLPVPISLAAGDSVIGENIFNNANSAPSGSISGVVTEVTPSFDSAAPGVVVYADLNNNGVFDVGEPSSTTSPQGTYTIAGLSTQTYHLREVVPSGFTQTSPSTSPTNITVGTGAVTGENFVLTANPTTTGSLLTGNIIGTPGSFQNDGNTIAKAFDGNFSTFYDAAGGVGNWAGLDLGSTFTITKVSFAPRANYASRMVGGIFQGSNTADFSSGVVNLVTVTTAPASGVFTSLNVTNTGAFRYVRYLSPNTSNGNVAELQFYGTASGTTNNNTASIAGTVSKVVSGATSGFAGVTVFLDTNNNGSLDAGELSTTTSSSGTYSFSNLAAGPYNIREVVPSGFSQTSPGSSPTVVSLATGQASTGDNFTDTAAAATGGTPLTGAIIGTPGSYQNDGNTIAKAFDGNVNTFYDAAGGVGNWAGLNLGSGFVITKVSYVPRANYASRMVGGIFQGSNTADFSSGVVNLATITAAPAGGVFTSLNVTNTNAFEFVRYLSPSTSNGNVAELEFFGTPGTVAVGTASIAGTISKVVSGATSGFSGVTVYLDNNNDGILDAGDASTITDSNGNYSFSSLVAGPYHVREVVPSGFSQSSPSSSPTNVTLTTGQASISNNFTDTAVTSTAITLSGNVFHDVNGNGVKDSGDAGLSGWVVYIDLNHDGKFESNENNKTTDANGNFSFVSLKAGTYQVRVVQKTGFTLTTPATGFFTVTLNPGVPVSVSFGEH